MAKALEQKIFESSNWDENRKAIEHFYGPLKDEDGEIRENVPDGELLEHGLKKMFYILRTDYRAFLVRKRNQEQAREEQQNDDDL